jgi:hypothetical protein
MAEWHVVVGRFGDVEKAREAVDLLHRAGFEGFHVGLVKGDASLVTSLLEQFGLSPDDTSHYAESVAQGGALVAVRADQSPDDAVQTLQRAGAENVQVLDRIPSPSDLT